MESVGVKRSYRETEIENEKKKKKTTTMKLITWKLGGKVVATSPLQFSSGHLTVAPGVAGAPPSSGSGRGPLAYERCDGLREKLARMGVRHPVSVMKKTISNSDVDPGQHRLQLPNRLLDRRLLWAVMSEEEEARTREDAGLEVRVLDRHGREYELRLRLVRSLEAYRVMGRDYTRLVEANALRKGKLLELLAFRLDGHLGLAAVDHEKNQQQQQLEMEEAAGGGDGEQQSAVMGWRRGNEIVEAALTLISMRRPLPSP